MISLQNKNIVLFCKSIIVITMLAPLYIIFSNSISGDAAIYFPFIKNFYALPFSYYDHNVSFGATSPLYVPIHAIIYKIFGEFKWIEISQGLNYLLIAIGLMLLVKATGSNYLEFLFILTAIIINRALFINTSQLYETAFAMFFICLLYFCLKKEKYKTVLLLSGILYLIRPEFFLLTFVIDIFLIRKVNHPVPLLIISIIPIVLYHSFIFLHTNSFIPSNIYAKMLRSQESGSTWIEKTLQNFNNLNYILILATISIIIFKGQIHKYKEELLILFPIPVFYSVFPSPADTPRYLLPIFPVLLSVIIIFSRSMFSHIILNKTLKKYSIILFSLFCFLLIAWSLKSYYNKFYLSPRYNYEIVLLKDLADKINPRLNPNDGILLYEIQGQYYINAFCYSLDGIVGNQIHRVLDKKDTFENFIVTKNIKYIVTMNSLNYRNIFRNTLMETLYIHDLKDKVGDTLKVNGLRFDKILTNKVFEDSRNYQLKYQTNLNVGNYVRVYNQEYKNFKGISPFWNSVYHVAILK